MIHHLPINIHDLSRIDMIKWRGNISGKEIIGIGLSSMNVVRLKRGYPIVVNGEEIGLPFSIIIHFGHSEKSMFEEVKKSGFVTDETTIHREDT